jgi:hypothetical protein
MCYFYQIHAGYCFYPMRSTAFKIKRGDIFTQQSSNYLTHLKCVKLHNSDNVPFLPHWCIFLPNSCSVSACFLGIHVRVLFVVTVCARLVCVVLYVFFFEIKKCTEIIKWHGPLSHFYTKGQPWRMAYGEGFSSLPEHYRYTVAYFSYLITLKKMTWFKSQSRQHTRYCCRDYTGRA